MATTEARAAVRTLIWDPAIWVMQETLAIGDGRRTTFQLSGHPAIIDSIQVQLDGEEITSSITIDYIHGLITLPAAPAEGVLLTADYAWAQLSDAAIDSQLDAVDGQFELASARCLEVLQLDPAAVLALRMEGIGVDLTARRAAISDAIRGLRERGGYGQFQVRVDAMEWGRS